MTKRDVARLIYLTGNRAIGYRVINHCTWADNPQGRWNPIFVDDSKLAAAIVRALRGVAYDYYNRKG